MLPAIPLLLVAVLQAGAASVPEGKLRCYDMFTQIGTVAVREFLDQPGHVEKAVYYVSAALDGGKLCDPQMLRVQSSRTYVRDSEGREIVEKQYGPDGRLSRTWTFEYQGTGRDAYIRRSFEPTGELHTELRHNERAHTLLVFDSKRRVAAVTGEVPADAEYSLGWGPSVDDWICGLGLPAKNVAAGGGRIVVHLRNLAYEERSMWVSSAFETDLRDAAGRLIPPTADYLALEPSLAQASRHQLLLAEGEAGWVSAVDLDRRYSKLAPGRYTLTVRLWHPETAEPLVSNPLAFDWPIK